MTINSVTQARVLELKAQNRSVRDIAAELSIGKSTVSDILKRNKSLTSSEPEQNSVQSLEQRPDNSKPIMPTPTLVISDIEATSFLESVKPVPSGAKPDPEAQQALLQEITKKLKLKAPKARPKKAELVEYEHEDNEVERQQQQQQQPQQKPQQPQPPQQVLTKGELISQITMLVNTYGKILTNHVKDPEKFLNSIQTKSVSDLKTTYELLNHSKTVANSANAMKHLFGVVSSGIEILSQKVFKLHTSGFAQAIMSNEEELRLLFTEISSNHIDSVKRLQSPETRLCFLLATTLLSVDSINRNRPVSGAVSGSNVNPETEQKFNDL
jgi:hypothetical protein